jgi:hypothetical protein
MMKDKSHLISVESAVKMFLCFLGFFVVIQISAQEDTIITSARNNWFKPLRVYPYDTIPKSAIADALAYQDEMYQTYGSYSAPQVQWTSLGPTPYYNGSTPRTGRVVCIKYKPDDPNTVYIAGHNGGIWKSTNSGSTFEPIADQLKTQSAGAIAIDPNNTNTIYYATGGNMYDFVYNYYGIGIFKSTNGGVDWLGPYKVASLDFTYSFRIVVNPANSNEVYLANGMDPFYGPGGGLYKSTNGGVNWAFAPNVPQNQGCNDVVISYDGLNPPRIYAAGLSGFGYWVSTNGGSSFFQPSNSGFTPTGRSHLAVTEANHDYALRYNKNNGE